MEATTYNQIMGKSYASDVKHTEDDIAEILPHLLVSWVRAQLSLLCTVLDILADELFLLEHVASFELDLDTERCEELQVLVMGCVSLLLAERVHHLPVCCGVIWAFVKAAPNLLLPLTQKVLIDNHPLSLKNETEWD